MKKIIYLLLVLGLVFTACEPLDDINSAIDAQDSPIVGDTEYILNDDDYDTLDLSYGSFSSENDAKSDIPALLTEMFPVWGKNSSVLVGYKLYVGNAFGLKDYSLKQADYTLSGSDLLGFQADASPAAYLADIISTNYSSPKEGDYVAATYFQYTGSAYVVTPKVSLEENFDYGTTAGDLTTISGGAWVNHSGAANQLMYATESLTMAGYPSSNVGGAMALSSSGSEDLNKSITPIITTKTVYLSTLINLSEVGDGTYFFHLMEEDGSFNYSARVGAKSDGSGNVLFGIGASSSSLAYGTTSFNLNTTYLLVATYNIDNGISNLYVLSSAISTEPSTPEVSNTGVSGNSANRIGIRQGGGGPTAILDGIRVANSWSSIMSNDVLADEVVGSKESFKAFYTYNNGAWRVPSSNFYALDEADFDSMSLSNFGSSTPPDDYLPTFLNIKFPYAQEGDQLDVAYKYVSSSSGAQTRGNLYTKTAGVWNGYQSTISTTLQFGHDGNAWIPDNTIKYTLVSADYAYMAATLEGNSFFANVSLTSLASYNDYDYNWSDAQILYSLDVLLNHLNPSAEDGQKYLITYLLYDNGTNDVKRNLIKQAGKWVFNE